MRHSSPRRFGRGTAALAAAGLVIALGAVAGGAVLATPAVAQTPECPPGTLPVPDNLDPDAWTDNNVAVYAGKDLQVVGTAGEIEGLLVVQRDALITKNGVLNIGTVGVGSGVAPTAGDVMFAVGDDLTIGADARIDVGFGATDEAGTTLLGGSVQVGGTTDPLYVDPNPAGPNHDVPPYAMNNGTLTQDMGAAATSQWDGWGDTLTQQSASFSSLEATGTVELQSGMLVFTGDGTATSPQVFTVDAATLAGGSDVNFVGIDDATTAVIINVTGSAPITWAPNLFYSDGVVANGFTSGDLFGMLAQRTMWNFAESTDVTIAGSTQVLGSLIVPGVNADDAAPTLTVTASTNGRVMTNGSILMNGQGNEMHNYPWNYGPFSCITVPGAFEIQKVVEGDGAPADGVFGGTWQCTADGVVVAQGVWSAPAGGSSGRIIVPAPSTCTITELVPDSDPMDGTWEDPVIDPASFDVDPATIADPVVVTVTNTWTPAPDVELGAFAVTKVVEGEGAPVVTFTGDWSCTLDGDVVAEGTWQAAAGETAGPFEAPVGAECTVTETPPARAAAGTWAAPSIDGSPVTIESGTVETPTVVTVTNTWTPTPVVVPGGFQITKAVEGDGAPGVTFTGTWTCSATAYLDGGDWSAAAGETTDVIAAPVGAVCTIDEDTPAAAAGGSWGTPAIDPSEFTVDEASVEQATLVTVTNTWTPLTPTPAPTPTPTTPAPLPATGGTIPWWALAVGGALLVAGAAVVIITVVRRRKD